MSANVSDLVGQTIADGRYEVTGHIGTGSMGHVYKAFDRRLETTVCLKIPTSVRLEDPDFYRRFEMESRFLVRLAHPQVVNIIDIGKEDGLPYIVMQYVSGGSLLDRMIDANGQPHPRPMRDLKHWLPSVAKALDFMHKEGCIHRDVKPANILFDDHNNAYLSDFGLSKILMEEESPDDNRMTAKGAVVGTPNYVAPEIVLAHDYDGSADQYSLATTVYEFLTGKAPLEGPSASATMVNQTTKQPPPLSKFVPSVPPQLNAAVLKALSKKPANRYASCEDFSDAVLAAVLAASGTALSPSGRSTIAGRGSTVVQRVPKYIVTKVSHARAPGKVPCPKCSKVLVLSDDYAGLVATCSGCQSRLKISQDISELGLLERNPQFKSGVHYVGPADHESEVQTILKAEFFGKKLSERQVLYFVGGAMGLIVLGAVMFSLGMLTPSEKQRSISTVKPVDREGSVRVVNEQPKVPVSIRFSGEDLSGDWVSSMLNSFSSTVASRGVQFSSTNSDDAELESLVAKRDARLPSIMLPQNRVESVELSAKWKQQNKGSLFAIEETVYFTPLVCLMWQKRYFAFRETYREVSVETLIDASLNKADWNSIANRPEWGLFRFSMPRLDDPEVGPLLQLTVAHQISGVKDELSVSDITGANLRDSFSKIERLAVKPSRGSANGMEELLASAAAGGPQFADAIVCTEQEALEALPALEEKWGFVQVVYLEPAAYFHKSMGVTSQSTPEQREAASAFVNYMKSAKVQRKLIDYALRPVNTDINVTGLPGPFSRYLARGVQSIPPRSTPLPSAEVIETLRTTYERSLMQ